MTKKKYKSVDFVICFAVGFFLGMAFVGMVNGMTGTVVITKSHQNELCHSLSDGQYPESYGVEMNVLICDVPDRDKVIRNKGYCLDGECDII